MSNFQVYQKAILKVFSILFLLISFEISFADDQPFEVKANMATFGCDDQVSFLDIYYELYPAQWTYKEDVSNQKTATVMLDLKVFENDQEVYSTKWGMQEIMAAGKTTPANLVKMDLMRLKVPSGQYEVQLMAVNLVDKTKSHQIRVSVQIPEINKQEVQSSEIMLCQEVRKNKTDDLELFVRDSLFVLPKVDNKFTPDNPALMFYFEIENLDQSLSKKSYSVKYYVLDKDEVMIQEIPMFVVRRKGGEKSIAQFGTISLSPVYTGAYWLNAVIEDSSGNMLVHKKVKFEMSNPDLKKVEDESYFAGLSIVDLHSGIPVNEEIEYIQYIIKREEATILKQIHDDYGKKKFLEGFWMRRNPDPERVHNSYRDEYLKRVTEANVDFGKSGHGWKTDLGRVYVLYGGPNDIQRRIANRTGRAYQIWQYDEIQGGVEFVFVDITGINNYQLVHSTLRGEMQDYNWERLIDVSNSSTNTIRQGETFH